MLARPGGLEPPTLWFEGHRFEISINNKNFPKLLIDCHDFNFSKRNLYLFKSFKDLSISPTILKAALLFK